MSVMAAGSTDRYHNQTSGKSTGRRQGGRETLYVDGNAVRKTLTVDFPQEDRQPSRRRRDDGTYSARRRAAAQEKSGLSIGYTIGLALACAAILYMCVGYLEIQADNAATLENIADLEEQLDELETENNDEYNRIVSSVDLEEIREKAINELGMVYAGEDQVVLYDGSENDYVTQYSEIPEEDGGLGSILGIINTGD